MSPNAGEGGSCGVLANECSCTKRAQINFGDLTLYLTYGLSLVDYGGLSGLRKQSAKLTADSIGHNKIADFRRFSRLNSGQNGDICVKQYVCC